MIVSRCSLELFTNCSLDIYKVFWTHGEKQIAEFGDIWRHRAEKCFSPGGDFAPFSSVWDIQLCPEMPFDCHVWRRVASDIWWIKGRGATVSTGRAPTASHDLAQDANIAEVEKAWLTQSSRKKYHLFRLIKISLYEKRITPNCLPRWAKFVKFYTLHVCLWIPSFTSRTMGPVKMPMNLLIQEYFRKFFTLPSFLLKLTLWSCCYYRH